MAHTWQSDTEITTRDTAVTNSTQSWFFKDSVASSHELIDATPKPVSTSGSPGAVFAEVPTSVAQIERARIDVPMGSNVWLRWDGAAAEVLSSKTTPDSLDGLTLQLNVDNAGAVTTTFTSGDTTMALAAKRINYYHGAQVASVDGTTGKLKIAGTKTGGADAKAAGRQYGEVDVVGGTALSALGLTEGTTPGSGLDENIGGPVEKTFYSGNLPESLEVSGSCSGARFMLAGKAS